ncbi:MULTISPECIES: DUF3285 domain-containing protein [Prochlorococcus]|uniref:Uncharacterized membrane protein n=1 Tax=Prochlorococcus marinus (strain SARG / CCMP1375 / SS120) TaxID=167539 RepID=Q7VE09_PROMA|nr:MULTISPECIES: DUF3285 domain-containing protein [Prochlorococcus]AAP99252.1 Uncharacterized membrane protein [Prochlorococcus marinus subsp. marinus str. CCMP1375]KGG18567.1 hypothetical protein EV08_1814 [Prochlorococcus marinus str. SS2]KGG32716.1 hypothetical protein EV10_1033 [Prochlorococcus marinus str. SS51]
MTQEPTPKVTSQKRTPPSSFIKLAMRNMVRKGSQSILHFGLTAIGLLIFIILIAVLGRPVVPH